MTDLDPATKTFGQLERPDPQPGSARVASGRVVARYERAVVDIDIGADRSHPDRRRLCPPGTSGTQEERER
ncbi:hypothetical protein ABN034_32030 [Actinopolymorpha sp. B11F2]|uniref:hypothetical protein n=1 Tax=Actinopolymorpha sp. B11F2 TaxID=3160862 RepID=UPI0032E3A7F0